MAGTKDSAEQMLALRRALNEVYDAALSADQILAFAGVEKGYEGRSLRAFLANPKASMRAEHAEALKAFWLESQAGRAIRNGLAKRDLPFDVFTRHLAAGKGNLPIGVHSVEGRYFMYHGSYLKEHHFVIRVIEITSEDGHVLNVTDTIQDEVGLKKDRTADGVARFVSDCFQAVLWGNENKLGVSVVLGNDPIAKDGSLQEVAGALMVMRKGGEVAYRPFIMIAEPDMSAKAMREQSGIFPWEHFERRGKSLKKHRQTFERLAKLQIREAFPDPVLALKAPRGSSRG
jgi:hypothetical protein